MESIQTPKRYTYADYAQWPDERCELIGGVPYMMSPSPNAVHQSVSREISNQLFNFLKGKPCKAFAAPFDVRLHAQGDDDDTVVQPDILVICDRSKLDDKGCNGVPDFIIEILSPSTASHDTITKLNLYLQAGVREYWIVDPQNKLVLVNVIDGERYFVTTHDKDSVVAVHTLEGCQINLQEVFSE